MEILDRLVLHRDQLDTLDIPGVLVTLDHLVMEIQDTLDQLVQEELAKMERIIVIIYFGIQIKVYLMIFRLVGILEIQKYI